MAIDDATASGPRIFTLISGYAPFRSLVSPLVW
jgi:hypothetical protein